MNKEFTRMQKLAGIITEGLYTSDAKASMEAMSHGKMTKKELKSKIKEMMTPEPDEDIDDSYDDSMDVYDDQYPEMAEGTIGQEAYAEMGSMDEVDSDYTADAYRVAKELIRRMPFSDALLSNKGLFLATIKALQDELYSYAEDQFGGAGSAPDEMGGMNEASYEASERMDGLAPVAARRSLVRAASTIIGALKSDGFEEEEIYDYLLDLITTLPMDESLFEAKKDEESDTEDVIVADTEEVPAEGEVDVTADQTKVDVNMDGIPDVDTGSAESKKAFTSLVDTYNASKELGDPKLTQMIANALTYYNKNIILKTGQPQA